ncbi:GMC family oxidoreductase [Allorhizobium pseudoryzae]|uniref:GMC family oxidoreductase n=1 Tax=Allorhizobium pseudoryzae TaxID=379684 RepID=UPI003D04B81E
MDMFDYIIVGAGSSGCVMAERLSSKATTSVLLIESGGDNRHPFITMPRGFGRVNGNPNYNWIYKAQPTGEATRNEFWLRGRGLGGSSAVNGSVYVRGLPDDFEEWRQLGCDGWGWQDIERAFFAIEGKTGGLLKVTAHPSPTVLCNAVIGAAGALGVPAADDLNTLNDAGIGYQPRTIHRGRRQSAAVAFLAEAAKRPNLRIMLDSDVRKVMFEDRRAVGVEIQGTGEAHRVHRAREVILCAGAINSPKLLLQSGIGPAHELQSLGIDTVADSPGVGRNLREHRLLSLQFSIAHGSDNRLFSGPGLLASLIQYYVLHRGPLTQAAFEVGGFIRTDPVATRPDAQIGFAPFSLDKSTQRLKFENRSGALCGGYPMRPESTGTIRLRSAEPLMEPLINPNYLAEEGDRRVSIGIVHFIRRLFAQEHLKAFSPKETWPGAAAVSDDEIIDAFHRHGGAGFHAAGTCAMGSDERSVVDTRTRVRGVVGLRVADISIMPRLVSGNTNAPAMAMAWRAAELIQQDA